MNIEIYQIILLIGIVLLASVLGVFALYSHTIMPGLRKTKDATFVQSFQAIDRKIINPLFMTQFFMPLVLLGIASFYASTHQLAEASHVYIATAAYLMAVIITMVVNVPLNDGIKKITDTTSTESLAVARTDFNESKWLTFNTMRTLFTLLAVIFASIALLA